MKQLVLLNYRVEQEQTEVGWNEEEGKMLETFGAHSFFLHSQTFDQYTLQLPGLCFLGEDRQSRRLKVLGILTIWSKTKSATGWAQ